MMKPVRMSKIRAICLKQIAPSVIKSLHNMSVLHIKDAVLPDVPRSGPMPSYDDVSSRLIRIRSMKEALAKYTVQKKQEKKEEPSAKMAVAPGPSAPVQQKKPQQPAKGAAQEPKKGGKQQAEKKAGAPFRLNLDFGAQKKLSSMFSSLGKKKEGKKVLITPSPSGKPALSSQKQKQPEARKQQSRSVPLQKPKQPVASQPKTQRVAPVQAPQQPQPEVQIRGSAQDVPAKQQAASPQKTLFPAKKEKEPLGEKEEGDTELDKMLSYVNKVGAASSEDVAKYFGLEVRVVEEYATSLAKQGLIKLDYNMFGKMALKSAKSEQKK